MTQEVRIPQKGEDKENYAPGGWGLIISPTDDRLSGIYLVDQPAGLEWCGFHYALSQ
jgi:hypothetical protein